MQEKTAKELSLEDDIFYINNESKNFGRHAIKELRDSSNGKEVRIQLSDLHFYATNGTIQFGIDDISYFLIERDWIKEVIPLQESRVDDLNGLHQDAKNYLIELKSYLAE